MKKIVAFAGLSLISAGAFAQTNLQVFSDFGKDRKFVTTTLEMFKGDDWGNTFFFVDYDYNYQMPDADNEKFVASPSNTYMEIARCLNFWGESALAPLSLQIEYNGGFGGGLGFSYPVTSAWLFGVDYFMHSEDFNNTLNLKVLYKKFKKDTESIPVQFTAVWGMQDIFGVSGLRFSGFVDFWGQKQNFSTLTDLKDDVEWVFLTEPQLWYAVGQHFGCENLNIGGEIEISNNFTQEGFMCNPCLGVKWNF